MTRRDDRLGPDFTEIRPLSRGYSREPETERNIADLAGLSRQEMNRRLKTFDYSDPLCPKLEALVYLLRWHLRDGREREAAEIGECLAARVARTVTARTRTFFRSRPDQAEDAEAAVILRMFEQLRNLTPAQEFWEVRFMVCLERVIQEAVRLELRRRRREIELSALDTETGEAADSIPDRDCVPLEQKIALAAALKSLAPEDQELVLLRHFEQFTEEEIAARLGVTSRTVRNRLARVQERLQAWRGEGE